MEKIEDIVERCKNKKSHSKIDINFSKILTKFFLSVIFVIGSLIYVKLDDENKSLYKEKVLTDSMSFTKVNNWYQKNFGSVLPATKKEQIVFSNTLSFKSIEKYLEGETLLLESPSIISNIAGGIVVFIGEKEGYGNTVIIQGNDGYDIWYGNLKNIGVTLYDYLQKETVLGETVDNKLYLVIKKDNNFYSYETYKN